MQAGKAHVALPALKVCIFVRVIEKCWSSYNPAIVKKKIGIMEILSYLIRKKNCLP